MRESSSDRTTPDFVEVHPLDSEDAAITAAIRGMAAPGKGAVQPVAQARAQFDAFMESVSPRGDVAFEPGTVGGVGGMWALPRAWRSEEAMWKRLTISCLLSRRSPDRHMHRS